MERYVLQKSENIGYWVCTDVDFGLVCVFKEKEFNQTQKNTLLDYANVDVATLSRIAREMCDWLQENHIEIL
jgi:hypothetical protein